MTSLKIDIIRLLLDVSAQQLFTMLVDPWDGLKVIQNANGELLVSDTTFCKLLKEHLPEL